MSGYNHTDVIKRLCDLQDKVSGYLGYDHAADCFCGHGGYWKSEEYDGTFEGGYRNEMVSIRFIEDAVAEKIEKEGDK